MAALVEEHVTEITHWNDTLFSFKTTRSDSFRFANGHFVMLGLRVDGKPLLRAYSIASANYDEYLEFFSIKVQDGPLTSRLQHLKIGDTVLVSKKPVGTLVIDDLKPGKRLVLLSTGTGLAPFLSITKDPEVYERFDEILLVHCVREKSELAYYDYLKPPCPTTKFWAK
jgi:ferredoxin--NADP+ reductase